MAVFIFLVFVLSGPFYLLMWGIEWYRERKERDDNEEAQRFFNL